MRKFNIILLFLLLLINVGCSIEKVYSFEELFDFTVNEIDSVYYDNGKNHNEYIKYKNDYKDILDTNFELSKIKKEEFNNFIDNYSFSLIIKNEVIVNHFYFLESKFYIEVDSKIYVSLDTYKDELINPKYHIDHDEYWYPSKKLEEVSSTCLENGYAKVKCEKCNQIIIEEFPLISCFYENDYCKWCNGKWFKNEAFHTHTYGFTYSNDLVIINSKLDLTRYYNLNKDKCSFEYKNGAYCFKDVIEKYSDEYFDSNSLLLFVTECDSSSLLFTIKSLEEINNELVLNYDVLYPSLVSQDLVGYHFIIEVNKKIETQRTRLNQNSIHLSPWQKYIYNYSPYYQSK